jgi:hypothetical protein
MLTCLRGTLARQEGGKRLRDPGRRTTAEKLKSGKQKAEINKANAEMLKAEILKAAPAVIPGTCFPSGQSSLLRSGWRRSALGAAGFPTAGGRPIVQSEGMLSMAGGALAQVLERCQVHGDAVRREIERLVSPAPAHSTTRLPPFTPRARKALQFAGAEAASLKHPLISPEDVVLGLLIEGSGVAALALKNLGVQFKRMRAAVSATRAH